MPPASGSGFDPKREIENDATFKLDRVMAALELKYIDAAIDLSRGNMSQAARMLGVSRSTLYSRLEALRPATNKVNP
jgi:two-component system nitrogen regulation response regulator GlnG